MFAPANIFVCLRNNLYSFRFVDVSGSSVTGVEDLALLAERVLVIDDGAAAGTEVGVGVAPHAAPHAAVTGPMLTLRRRIFAPLVTPLHGNLPLSPGRQYRQLRLADNGYDGRYQTDTKDEDAEDPDELNLRSPVKGNADQDAGSTDHQHEDEGHG
jgi:hypothetical protein